MSSRLLASLLVVAAFTLVSRLGAQSESTEPAEPPPLVGRVDGHSYVSPLGTYRVEIPVLPELGGVVSDTENVVTFQDAFNIHASIACFPMDATQRWEHETRGRKDYLIWFFSNFVQADFQQRYAGSRIESARFMPSLKEGSLLAYNILPGGSMFYGRIMIGDHENPPDAKRGNLLFVQGENIYVLSIELAEKVIERTTFKKTVDEENEILRERLVELLSKITFTPPPKPAK